MKVYLGPAGIPTVAEERSTEGGLATVSKLGLNAMEVEFVRNVYLTPKKAELVGEIAERLGIQLTVHAPYYLNLLSEKSEIRRASKRRILDSLERAEVMKARIVVVHAAYYGNLEKREALERMKIMTFELLDRMKGMGVKNVKLAYETMAKDSQFADLDTLLKLLKNVRARQLTICVDFAHLFARGNGKLSYPEVLEKVRKFDHLFAHFSNMKYDSKTKRFVDVHVPMNSHPPFEPLAKEIAKRKLNITIISESPVLEQDSLKMVKVFKKLGVSISS